MLAVGVWFVADFEALFYQVTPDFDKSEKFETCTATAIFLSRVSGSFLFILSV